MANTNEQDRRPNEHQRQLENRIKKGDLRCYSQSDIDKSHVAVDAGGCGIIYKAIMKISGKHVAIKKLRRRPYEDKSTVYKMLAKENPLGDTPDHISVFFDEPERNRMDAPVNAPPSSDYQPYLKLDWIRHVGITAFEKILKPNYDSVWSQLDRIKTEFLESNPCLCRLYNILTNALKSDDPLNSLYVALGKEAKEIVESNTFERYLYDVVVTVVEVLVEVQTMLSF
ncbi:1187_t:CDS:2 [Paraglomus brasilianum]|uniref:1187_t:CDS:1 n=1 Tax=Paraglomus brasilianum TaxID=144538 RepID=A0A9N9GZ01_9GLOM|nr:1187_t:CDS:2 [Paraglomus brasilianum]